jgi:hypothetical protein
MKLLAAAALAAALPLANAHMEMAVPAPRRSK